MIAVTRALALVGCARFGMLITPVLAQKTGGTLKFYHRDSPASGSIHEEATVSAVAPFMAVFNNHVLFRQDEKKTGQTCLTECSTIRSRVFRECLESTPNGRSRGDQHGPPPKAHRHGFGPP